METRVEWILLSGLSVPVVVREQKDGSYVATPLNWHVEAQGASPTEALRELSRELDRRVERAVEEERRASRDLDVAVGMT